MLLNLRAVTPYITPIDRYVDAATYINTDVQHIRLSYRELVRMGASRATLDSVKSDGVGPHFGNPTPVFSTAGKYFGMLYWREGTQPTAKGKNPSLNRAGFYLVQEPIDVNGSYVIRWRNKQPGCSASAQAVKVVDERREYTPPLPARQHRADMCLWIRRPNLNHAANPSLFRAAHETYELALLGLSYEFVGANSTYDKPAQRQPTGGVWSVESITERDPDTDFPLYWNVVSNKWCEFACCSEFTRDERASFTLPPNARWRFVPEENRRNPCPPIFLTPTLTV